MKYILNLAKRGSLLLLCAALLLGLTVPALAAENVQTISRTEVDLGNGFSYTETLTVSPALSRASAQKTGSKSQDFTYNGTKVAVIGISGTFQYDGSSVGVVSKSVSQKTLYDGWAFSQSSFTSSGGTITLTGTLSKGTAKVSVNLSLTCDKNGNIS